MFLRETLDRMIRQFELIERVKRYDPNLDEDMLNKAYVYSMKAHGSQLRASGDPYFLHPLEVAGILADLRLDCASVVTGLLHDTVEDTLSTLNDIEHHFGSEVAQLVDGVTKLSRIELQSEKTKQAENFRKLVMAMSTDIRVLLVKLADRLHNMRTIQFFKSEEKRRRIATETMEIYSPLAGRIGMSQLKDELDDLSFAVLYPEKRQDIIMNLRKLHDNIGAEIGNIIIELESLLKDGSVLADIYGREKSPYSIWLKMEKQNIDFDQLSDIMAFRILVKDVSECYRVLGLIHSKYMVIPGRFKDFISTPRQNGYQSIHTTIIGPKNFRVEIQVRTHEMHHIAEYGVAAHWQYKQNQKDVDGKKYAWIRSLLEIMESASSPEEFLENTKFEIYQDQVFCFTPKGDLITLPRGATAIDFAYAVHSEVGDRAVAVKINGRQKPLRTPLENGDQVEIITQKKQNPSPLWDQFVITGKARSKIRKFIQNQENSQFIRLGKAMLQAAFSDLEEKEFLYLTSLFVEHYGYSHEEELFINLSKGKHLITEIKSFLQKSNFQQEIKLKSHTSKKSSTAKSEEQFSIEGLIPGMAIHFSECCHPVDGDKIVGILASQKGILIHTKDCSEISLESMDSLLSLKWTKKKTIPQVKRLYVTFINKPGSLASMATEISNQNADIINIKVVNRSDQFWDLEVDVEVHDQKHLQQVMGALRSLLVISNVSAGK